MPFETTHSASSSTDVDALKFRLVQYDTFYDSQMKQDGSKGLLKLIEVINTGSGPFMVLMIIIPQRFLYLMSYFHLC